MREPSKNMTPYSLDDIEKYLQGKLSPAEMHELEKTALQDPFLADAIEGYQSADLTIVKQDLAGIHNQLASEPAKIIPAPARPNSWWRIAAALVVLTGVGILGSKWFTGNEQTNQVATQTSIPLPKFDSPPAAEMPAGIPAGKAVIKKDMLSKNDVQSRSRENKAIAENKIAKEREAAEAQAALTARALSSDRQNRTHDSIVPIKDLTTSGIITARVNAPAAQPNVSGQTTGLLSKKMEPSFPAKKDNTNSILANGNLAIAGRQIVLPALPYQVKNARRDTIKLDNDEMPYFSRVGYVKPDQPAVTSVGGLALLSVTGKVVDKKRIGISIDTPVLTDQKKMFITLSEITAAASLAAPNFDVAGAKKDTMQFLPGKIMSRNNATYKTSKEEPDRAAGDVPETAIKKEVGFDIRETPSVIPAGGWADFTKYVNSKISEETNAGNTTILHGSVKIKMDISEKGKVNNITILNSFNTRFNQVIIKAIRKGQPWISSDHLAKKDHVFVIVL